MAKNKTYYDPQNGQHYYHGETLGAANWSAPESIKDESYINQYNYTPSYNAYRQYLEEEKRRQEEEARRMLEATRPSVQVTAGAAINPNANVAMQTPAKSYANPYEEPPTADQIAKDNLAYLDRAKERIQAEHDSQHGLFGRADAQKRLEELGSQADDIKPFISMDDSDDKRLLTELNQKINKRGTLTPDEEVAYSEAMVRDMFKKNKGLDKLLNERNAYYSVVNDYNNDGSGASGRQTYAKYLAEDKLKDAEDRIKKLTGWSDEEFATNMKYVDRINDRQDTQAVAQRYAIDKNATGMQKLGQGISNELYSLTHNGGIVNLNAMYNDYMEEENRPRGFGANIDDPSHRQINQANAAMQANDEQLGSKGQFVYETAHAAADSLVKRIPAMVATGATGNQVIGEVVGLTPYFLSAYNSGYQEARERGATEEEAKASAITQGAVETITELLPVGNAVNAAMGKDAGKSVVKRVIKQMAEEGAEEGLGDLVNELADYIIFRKDPEVAHKFEARVQETGSTAAAVWDLAKEVMRDTASGALSALPMAGINIGTSNIAHKTRSQQISESAKGVGESIKGDSEYEKSVKAQMEQYEKNPTRYIADNLDESTEENRKYKAEVMEVAQKEARGEKLTTGEKMLIQDALNSSEEAKMKQAKEEAKNPKDYSNIPEQPVPIEYRDKVSNLTEDEARTLLAKAAASGDADAFTDAMQMTMASSYEEVKNNAQDIIKDYTGMAMSRGISQESIGQAMVTRLKAYEAGLTGETMENLSERNQIAYNEGRQVALAEKARTTIEGDAIKSAEVTTKDGASVKLEGAFTSDGIQTSDGSVKLEDLDLTNDTAVVKAYKYADRYDNVNVKNAFLSNIKDGQNIEQYKQAFDKMYDSALAGVSYENAKKSYTAVDEDVLKAAYQTGQTEAGARSFDALSEALGSNVKKGSGMFLNESSSLDSNAVQLFTQLAKRTGLNIRVVDDMDRKSARGSFNASDSTITLRADEAVYAVNHELAEFTEVYNKAEYDKLRTAIANFSSEKLGNDKYMRFMRQYKSAYARAGQDTSADEMSGEMFNDTVAIMMGTEKGRQALVDYLAQNYDEEEAFMLGKQLSDFVKGLAKAIKKAFQGIKKRKGYEGEMQAYADELSEYADQFIKALNGAVETYKGQAVNNVTEIVGVHYDAASEMVYPADYSLETWDASDYQTDRKNAAKDLAKVMNISQKKALEYIDDINSIAKIIADDRVRLDYDSDEGSAVVSNADYGASVDFSTICKKRLLYTGTLQQIQKQIGNRVITVDDYLAIRQAMIRDNLETTCGCCYVEGSRAKLGGFMKEFIKKYAATKPDYVPTMYDVSTPDGIRQLRTNHPEVYKAREYFLNHYGKIDANDTQTLFASQQKPKDYTERKAYKGEILKMFKGKKDKVAEKNLNGGLRLQSFSDFEVVNLLDCMQVITDMARCGLAGQAYTKVKNFADALGNTGLKINLSLMAKGVDKNGNLILDEMNGMKKADAEYLRNKYSKNVGTIIVCFTDEQIKAAMKDDMIDFIIPFHRSQWQKSQYEALGLPEGTKDYTNYQEDGVIGENGRRRRADHSYMSKEYWDFSKSGRENAETYIKMCNDNNKVPVFDFLLEKDKNGKYVLPKDADGYFKLLIDFKMYDNDGVGSPQVPVTPNFSLDECKQMLTEYEGGHETFPVDQKIADEFTKKITKREKEFKYSLDVDSEGNQLTEEQADYFKDSQIRDENGNLKVMYHGTQNDFTVFDPKKLGGKNGTAEGYGIYFTENPEISQAYGGKQLKGYLNVTHPAEYNKKTIKANDLVKLIKATAEAQAQELLEEGYDSVQDALKDTWVSNIEYTYDKPIDQVYRAVAQKILSMNHNDMDIIQEIMADQAIRDYESAYEFYDILQNTLGIDGFITEWEDSRTGEMNEIVVAFNSNQFKNADNQNPTDNEDIRYSIEVDANGKKYVDIQDDLISGITDPSQIKDYVREYMKEYFPSVNMLGYQLPVTKVSRNEYTGSVYTQTIEKQLHNLFVDKMRMAANLDEIVKSADGLKYEPPKHSRTDDIIGFVRGKIQIRVGTNDYLADVVLADRKNAGLMFYDIVSLRPTNIKAAAQTISPNGVRRQAAASNTNISQKAGKNNIKHSLEVDSEGKKLTKDQAKYFAKSKLRDENGALKVMYHGTPEANFTIFDPQFSDDESSLFFTDSHFVAAGYAGTDTFVNPNDLRTKDVHTFEQLQKRFEETDWEVREEDGEIVIYNIDDPDDPVEMVREDSVERAYEEWTWTYAWDGEEGEFGGLYRVYLNIENPLVIDAEERNWEDIYADELVDEDAKWYTTLHVIDPDRDGKIFVEWVEDQEGSGQGLLTHEEFKEKFGDDLYKEFQKHKYLYINNAYVNPNGEWIPNNTRGLSEYAKKHGYDGLIINNLVDEGQYSRYSEAAQIVVVYNSNQVKSVDNEHPTADNNDIRYSLDVDSEGNTLSEDQNKYFKDSESVDDKGRLLVLYHGSQSEDFTVFDPRGNSSQFGRYKFGNHVVNFFTSDKGSAESYSKLDWKKSGKVYKGYANVTRPFKIDAQKGTSFGIQDDRLMQIEDKLVDSIGLWIDEADFDRASEMLTYLGLQLKEGDDGYYEIYRTGNNSIFGSDSYLGSGRTIEDAFYDVIDGNEDYYKANDRIYSTDNIAQLILGSNDLLNTNYDGIIVNNVFDSASAFDSTHGTDVITLKSSNQFKSIDNKQPTSDSDIRYSIDVDSEGRELTEGQQKYFNDSKVVDDNGALKVMYHGTRYGHFTVFNPEFSDDKISLFFSDSKEVSGTYVPEANKGRFLDIDNLPKYTSINTGEEAVDYLKTKGFTDWDIKGEGLYSVYSYTDPEGDRIENLSRGQLLDMARKILSDSRQGLYAVYLNIENPLVIDAQGSHWNKLTGRAFAREKAGWVVADFYAKKSGDGTYDVISDVMDVNLQNAHLEDIEKAFDKYSRRVGNRVVNWIKEYGDIDFRNVFVNYDIGQFIPNDTRTAAQMAKKGGYDGVIIKNVKDNGGISYTQKETTSNIAIAFSPEQVKDINNINPTSSEDIRYSIGVDEGDEWINPLEYLASETPTTDEKAVDILEKGMEALKNSEVDTKRIRSLALKLRNEYGSSYDLNTLVENLEKAFAYMQTEDHVDYQTMMGILKDIARPVLEASDEKVNEEEYKDFINVFKGRKIKLTAKQKEEVKYVYGSYGKYRNGIMPITISDNADTTLDQIWDELVEQSGYRLDRDASEGDMPLNLMDVLQASRPTVQNSYGGDIEDVSKDLAMRIVEEYIEGESAKEMKKNVDEYRAKLKKDYQERRRELKGQVNAEARARNKRKSEQAKERENIRNLRHDIKMQAGKLLTWLEKPTEGKSVPHDMVVPITQFLQAFDFVDPVIRVDEDGKYHIRVFDRVDWEGTQKRFKYKDLVGDTAEDVLKQFNEAIGRGEGTKEQRSWTEKMQGIKDIYDKAQKDEDFEDSSMEMFVQSLDAQGLGEAFDEVLKKNNGELNMNHLSASDLDVLDKVIKNIFHAVNQGNKAYSKPSVDLVNLAQSTIEDSEGKELKSRNRILEGVYKMLRLDNVTPRTFFKLLGKRGIEVYKFLRGGLNQEILDLKQASEFMEKTMEGIDAKKWTGRDAVVHEFAVSGGTIRMTDAQIMGLYCTVRRNGGQDRIIGGIKVDTIPRKGVPIKQETMHLTPADITKIESVLTPEQIEVAKKMQKYMAEDCAKQGNETSMKLYGFKKFTDPTYYPWSVDKRSVPTRNSTENTPMFTNIERSGFTKQLQEGANNTLIIRDIFDVFTDHVAQMAAYHGYAASVKDTLRWLNYKEKYEENGFMHEKRVKDSVDLLTGSEQGVGYITNLLLDINQANKSNYIGNFTDILIGNYKAAAVGANLRVVAQQPTAYFRALNMIDAKYLFGVNPATAIRNIKKSQEECPISWWKSKGYYETNLGQPIKEIVTGIASPAEKAKDIMMSPAGWADDVTWGFLYTAVEREQRDRLRGSKYTEEEFRKAVNDRFDEMVDNTQVVDSTLHRSQYMRSKDRLNKLQTAFMAEPTKSYNMLLEAGIEDLNEGKTMKRTARAVTAFLLSTLATSAAAAVVDAMRKNKDDEEWWETWLKNLKENMADNMNPFNLLPVVKDVSAGIYNLLTGTSTYGQSGQRFDIEAISSIMTAAQTIGKLIEGESNKTGYGVFMALAKPFSQVTGIPAYNMIKDTVALYNTFFDNIETTVSSPTAGRTERKKDFVKDVNREKSVETLDEGIVNALEHGISIYDLKGAVQSEYKSKYFDAYAEGETKEAKEIAEKAARAYARMGLTDEQIDEIINEWQEEVVTYADLDKAIANGENPTMDVVKLLDFKDKDNIVKHLVDRYAETIAYEDTHNTESSWRKGVEQAITVADPSLNFDTAHEEILEKKRQQEEKAAQTEKNNAMKSDFYDAVERKDGAAGRKALEKMKSDGVEAKTVKSSISTRYHEIWKEAKTQAEKDKAKSDWKSAYTLVNNVYGVDSKDLDKTWAEWEKSQ